MARPSPPSDTPVDRRPPANLDAESSLLGAALLAPVALEVLATKTEPADFYKPAHGHIADALRAAYADGWPADPVTVADWLERRGLLDAIGGPATLVTLQSAAPSTGNAARYAGIVHDLATLRRLMGAGSRITEIALERGDDPHRAVLRAQELIGGVAALNGTRSYSSLDIADVAALLDADLEPEEADFLVRTDGRALFYAGKMHVLKGLPSSGKTWIALEGVKQVLEIGGAAVHVDWEDSAKGIVGRLLALGADPAMVRARFRYVQPAGAFGPTERVELFRLLDTLNPDLVILDGVAEALARDGYDEDKAGQVVQWIEKLPRPIARTGAAVVMLDHVKKPGHVEAEGASRFARGSGAKLGAVDGASYDVKAVRSFSRQRSGTTKLIVDKDRPGGVGAIGETAAVVTIEPHADGARVVLKLERETVVNEGREPFKPTVLMAKVSAELEAAGPLPPTTLKSLVHSDKPRLVTEAISRLIAEGFVAEVKVGRSKMLRLVRPYAPGNVEPDAPPHPAELFDDVPDNVTRGPWPPSPDDPDYDPDTHF